MSRKILLAVLALAVIGVGSYFLFFKKTVTETDKKDVLAAVQEGEFEVVVTSTGELQAKRSEKIMGPEGMRSAGIWQTQIADLIPEGTVVEAGDYVGRLDRSELDGKLQNLASEIEKIESQLLQTKLDTAINLRGLRDNLVNLKFSMREKQLEVEQSKYEPPAVIRRVQLDLERIQRDFTQQLQNYKLKQEQAEAQIKEILATLEQNTSKYKMMMDLATQFTVTAPKGGMVIYDRGWEGKKGPGSRVSSWDPVIAQLPDLSDMVSKSFVNEVDISKIKLEQVVEIRVDAFPDKTYKGKVIEIANIGEQLKKFDAKVFEVVVQLLETDSILRPAMTTSNQIVTSILKKEVFIPLECLHTDSLSYVFKKTANGIVKQEIITGDSNDEAIIIRYGDLKKGEQLYMNIPENSDKIPIVRLSEKDKKAYDKEVAEAARKQKEEEARRKKMMEDRLKALENKPAPVAGGAKVIISN